MKIFVIFPEIDNWIEHIKNEQFPDSDVGKIFNIIMLIGKSALGQSMMDQLNDKQIKYLQSEKDSIALQNEIILEEDLRKIRLQSINFEIFYKLLELDQDYIIRWDDEVSIVYRKVISNLNWLAVLLNDIFSAKKESKTPQFKFNLINIRTKEKGFNEKQSVQSIIHDIELLNKDNNILLDEIQSRFPFYKNYFIELKQIIEGYIFYCIKSRRYSQN